MSIRAEFGWIEIKGDKYTNDIVIHADGKITKRNKKKSKDLKAVYGHTPLSEHELRFLSKEDFDVLYVGSGHYASLPITLKALKVLTKYNTIILPTSEVISKIEQEQKRFVAIIHVTC